MSASDQPSRIDRRVALKWISTAASLPALSAVSLGADSTAKGYGPDPNVNKIYKPGELWSLTFSNQQRQLVISLCDIIIPADAKSPSASSLGVHDFVDEWISSPYPAQARDRKLILKGLEWLASEHDFADLKPEAQFSICRDLAKSTKQFPGSFFLRMRNLVAGGYYTTPVGMRDVGYLGNVPMGIWNGPPPEVLEKLGLSAAAE